MDSARLPALDHLAALIVEQNGFAALVDDAPADLPVPGCDPWTADLAAALGVGAAVDPTVAGDCVAEVVDTMQPRQVALGRMAPPAGGVRLAAPTGGWLLGPAPVVEVTGPADALALLPWRRPTLDDDRLSVSGDRAAAVAVLAGPVVP